MFLRAVALAGLMALAAPVYAVTGIATVEFTATNFKRFYGGSDPAPQSVVKGKFSYSYDSEAWYLEEALTHLDITIAGKTYAKEAVTVAGYDGAVILSSGPLTLGYDSFQLTIDRVYQGEPYQYYPLYFIYSVTVADNMDADGYWTNDIKYKWTGLPGGAIPEPATWAMLITGFGLVGTMARRRRIAIAHA